MGTVDFDTAGTGDFDFTFAGSHSLRTWVRAVDRAQGESQSELAAGHRGPEV